MEAAASRGGLQTRKEEKSNFVPALSNFSIQYNLSSASIALPFMQAHPDFDQPDWVHYVAKGAVFVGAVLGMVVMGYLGDILGRKRAMVITMAMQVVGALGCALFTFGNVQTIYAVFCAMRLLLGVGVGGMYPLSASHSAEGSGTEEGAASRVGWAFFWQTPGSMAPYAVALLMLFGVGDKQCSYFTDEADCMNLNKTHNAGECQWNDKGGVCMFGEHDSVALPSFEFRFLVGLGALPAFIVMLSAMKETDSTEFTEAKQAGSRKGICQEISEHPEYWKTLIGTGGTWFLYDVSYYGTAIFLPDIQTTIFGQGETLFAMSWQSLVVNGFGLVGIIAALWCLKRFGNRWLSLYGFVIVAALFAAMALTYTVSDADSVAQGTPAAQGFCCTSAQECAAPESTENLVHALSITFDTDGQHADITATALTEAKVVNGTSHMGSYVPFSCKSEVTTIQGKIVSFPDSAKVADCLGHMLNVSAFSSNASDLTVSFDKASKILKVTDSGQSITLKRCSGKTPETAPSWSSSVLFVELILLTIALNFGPNVSTFVLPAMAFPAHVRSTFHGLSAGSGKVGAVVGTFIYEPIAESYGIPAVMWLQCALSVLGVAISFYFIADDSPSAAAMRQPLLSKAGGR